MALMHIAPGSSSPRRPSAGDPTPVSGGLICALALAVSLGPALAGQIVAGNTAARTPSARLGTAPLGLPCQSLIPGVNVYIDFSGTTSGCSELGGTCRAGEAVAFRAASFGYNFGCTLNVFSWSFGDGSTGSGQAVTHVFAFAGSYTVKLTITNGSQTVSLVQEVLTTNHAPARRRAIVPPEAHDNPLPLTIDASGGTTSLTANGPDTREDRVPAMNAAIDAVDSAIAMDLAAELLSQLVAHPTSVLCVELHDLGDGEALEIIETIVETQPTY